MDQNTIDIIVKLTVPVIGALFSILAVIITSEIGSHIKNKAASDKIDAVVQSAIGAIQQAITNSISPPYMADVPGKVAIGVRYVLTHAAPEADRLNLTPVLIADRIHAAMGLRSLAISAASISRQTLPINLPASPTVAPQRPVPN